MEGMGRWREWGDGEMGRWGDGKMGGWGDREIEGRLFLCVHTTAQPLGLENSKGTQI
jgi:hypothetical protein